MVALPSNEEQRDAVLTGTKVWEEATTPLSGYPKMVATNPSATLVPSYHTARRHAHNKHRRSLAYQLLSVTRSRRALKMSSKPRTSVTKVINDASWCKLPKKGLRTLLYYIHV